MAAFQHSSRAIQRHAKWPWLGQSAARKRDVRSSWKKTLRFAKKSNAVEMWRSSVPLTSGNEVHGGGTKRLFVQISLLLLFIMILFFIICVYYWHWLLIWRARVRKMVHCVTGFYLYRNGRFDAVCPVLLWRLALLALRQRYPPARPDDSPNCPPSWHYQSRKARLYSVNPTHWVGLKTRLVSS